MSQIEWTDETWNPIVGCSKVSPGCANCYAERMACRLQGMYDADPYGKHKHLKKYLEVVGSNWRSGKYDHWNGKTYFDESALTKPLKRKKATMYFVCSMGDLFHESVPFEWIDKVFAVMALCPQHTFQILTKRPERMAEYLANPKTKPGDRLGRKILPEVQFRVHKTALEMVHARHSTNQKRLNMWDGRWPLSNVWLGTTAENQEQADRRIPHLLKCPVAKRFVSVEPMLGAVDLTRIPTGSWAHGKVDVMSGFLCGEEPDEMFDYDADPLGFVIKPADEWDRGDYGLDWVICGGESGPGARPMHPDWARSLRDQCKAAGVPFFFKQWGEWAPTHPNQQKGDIYFRSDGQITGKWVSDCGVERTIERDERIGFDISMRRIGKKKAGSLLDGVEHKEYPK